MHRDAETNARTETFNTCRDIKTHIQDLEIHAKTHLYIFRDIEANDQRHNTCSETLKNIQRDIEICTQNTDAHTKALR